MVAWLEGGDLIKKGENKGSICQNFVGKSVSMFINFETNWDNMDNIEFVDDTKGDVDTSVRHWINTNNCIVTMSYTDAKTGKQKTLVMVKSPNYDTDYTWKAALPSGVNNMYTDQIVKGLEETRVKTGSDGKQYRCVRYVATGGNKYQTTEKYRPYPCAGHWDSTGRKEMEDVTEETKTSDWYLCSNLSGSQAAKKLSVSLDADNVYKYTVSLKANSTYTFNFKNTVSFKDSSTTTYYGGSGTITDTADLQALTKVESTDKFTLKTTKAGNYTITLDVSVEDNYKFAVTKKETVDEGRECSITVTLLDETSSTWIQTNVDNGDKIVVVFSNNQETVLDYKQGYAFYQKENIKVPSGTKIDRIEMRKSQNNEIYFTWGNLNMVVTGSEK